MLNQRDNNKILPTITTAIHPEFKKLFDELEQGHIALREKLNALSLRGTELEERLTAELAVFSPWRFQLMDNLGRIAFDEAPEQRETHQQYIAKTRYYQIVQEAPFYWQIMNKPEGYAGDAEMMNLIYRNRYEGNTPFGMLLHKDAVASDACQAVRNRRTFLRERIMQGGRILSIAAGPAMEIRDVLMQDQSEDTYHCHAFDHDIKTIRKTCRECTDPRLHYVLGNAFNIIKGYYRVAVPRKAFLEICKPRQDFRGWRKVLVPVKYGFETLKKENYDLVYTAGLYDYITTFPDQPEKGTIALTKHLFALLKPGGTLVIGNFSPNNPRDLKFAMDYINDWQLIYRDEKEMFEFAQAIPDREIASMKIEQEPLGINYFLIIEKNA